MQNLLTIRKFYENKNVLITGGTGFMGKVLIEKLLYSVPNIGTIYLLMRPKRGKSVKQRLAEMLCLPLFNRIKHQCPSAVMKLKPLQGDVLFEKFGLSDSDFDGLSEVNVFFHLAATLKLEAPLKDNVNMNTCGTERALNVAKQLNKLLVFVHMSTAFCYPDYEVLDEKVHPPPLNPRDVMRLIEWMDDHQLSLITPSLLGEHPNCYTLSKRLAESLVKQAFNDLPVTIARPSIVCPSVYEPLRGWVDNLNGPIGVMLGAGKGVIRSMLCNGKLAAQVIPADTAINAIIAIGMLEATRPEKAPAVPVYNLNIGHQKPTSWGEVLNIGKEYGRKYPLAWPLWYPNGDITTNETLHRFRIIFYHFLPAYILDFFVMLLGQKRFMVKIQKRISVGLEFLQYFTMRPWIFLNNNFESIQVYLDPEERKMFNTDLSNVDRVKYLGDCIEGGRVFCLKEDPGKVSFNRTYHSILYALDWITKILFWLLILSFIVTWFEPVKVIFSYGKLIIKHLPFLGSAVFEDED